MSESVDLNRSNKFIQLVGLHRAFIVCVCMHACCTCIVRIHRCNGVVGIEIVPTPTHTISVEPNNNVDIHAYTSAPEMFQNPHELLTCQSLAQ